MPQYAWLYSVGLLLLLLIGYFIPVIWSLRLGYSTYAKIPHALGVAIASQVMAGLAVLISIALVAILNS